MRHYIKTIPYKAEKRETSENHGFKLLKGRLDEIRSIPEVQDIQELHDALADINHPDTPFFSTGCEKKFNQENGIFWVRGFVEFAFNHPELALDAVNYFKLFFKFNWHVWEKQFDIPLRFHFEMDGADFVVIGKEGFSVCVWITTDDLQTADEAKNVWCKGVRFFSQFLRSISKPQTPTIYQSP